VRLGEVFDCAPEARDLWAGEPGDSLAGKRAELEKSMLEVRLLRGDGMLKDRTSSITVSLPDLAPRSWSRKGFLTVGGL
jgi:hypothetical protein